MFEPAGSLQFKNKCLGREQRSYYHIAKNVKEKKKKKKKKTFINMYGYEYKYKYREGFWCPDSKSELYVCYLGGKDSSTDKSEHFLCIKINSILQPNNTKSTLKIKIDFGYPYWIVRSWCSVSVKFLMGQGLGKQCEPRSECSYGAVWSGSTLLAILSASFRPTTPW